MGKDVIKRAGAMVLISGVLFGGVWGARTAYGAQFVRMDGDNWRLVSYVVPAARYEQQVNTALYDGKERFDAIGINCYDAQDRLLCSISLDRRHHILPGCDTYVYRDGGYTQYSRDMSGCYTYVIETDAQGRATRVEADGHATVYWYNGDDENPSGYEYYNEQGVLAERSESQTVQNADGTTIKTSTTWDENGEVSLTTEHVYDARGNLLSSTVDAGADGRSTSTWTWRYDDIGRTATCIRADGSETKTWYDEQGRVIKQDNDHGRWVTTTEYKDVTK